MPLGLLIDRFACGRLYMLTAFSATLLLQLATPLLVDGGNFAALLAVRCALGVAQGGLFPNLHRLTTRWAPPGETGKFVVSGAGFGLGTLLTWAIAGGVVERFGWRWSFRVDAAMVAVFVALYAYHVYDRPALHPRIAAAERRFIESSKPAAMVQRVSA